MGLKANHRLYKRLVRILFTAVLGVVVGLFLVTFVATAQPDPDGTIQPDPVGTVVWLKGPDDPVRVSTEITVTISISDVTGLYGGQLELSFDPDDLQVVNVGSPVTPDECPVPNFVASNVADNMAGTINYAVTQLNPTPPVSGDCDVGHIRFLTQQAATSVISFAEVILSDVNGLPIPNTTLELTVDILPLQPRADFSGSPTSGIPPLMVDFTNESTGDIDTCTWDFGDGGSSMSCGNPSHEYTTVGVYSVSLTVSGPGGSNTEMKTDYITIGEEYYNYLPLISN